VATQLVATRPVLSSTELVFISSSSGNSSSSSSSSGNSSSSSRRLCLLCIIHYINIHNPGSHNALILWILLIIQGTVMEIVCYPRRGIESVGAFIDGSSCYFHGFRG
jgi:hypothetical protein